MATEPNVNGLFIGKPVWNGLNKTLVLLLSLLFSVSTVVAADGELTLEGHLSQGGLVTGSVPTGAVVRLNGKNVDVDDAGTFVIGFGRDAEAKQHFEWQLDGQPAMRYDIELKQRKYDIQRVEGVPQKMVTPSADKTARIKKESALVYTARQTDSGLPFFQQAFKAPLEGVVTGVYGSQRVYNGTPKRPHFGVDFAAPVGTLVYAPADGVVTLTHDDMYYSGGTLIMDHGFGVSSTFIHLSELLVSDGQEIKQGEVIAKVGQGGRSTGPHLDWRVNWYQVRIDPQLVLDRNTKTKLTP